jgi:Tol biopolymer transport system component/tRNA A-37 threonylcarbamoyl transferase component Bud32
MALGVGKSLGPYEIVSQIGAGGMGEVYKARDTRLDRTVAIKVLPPERIRDPQARERFDREARAISSLNHPRICTLHDVGHEGGIDFLVMEYVEGKSLKGPVPVDEALRLGAQIADALDHAHRHGVVHRDLKPENILVTKSGVKVLDFGVAKLSREPERAQDATVTQTLTQEGTVVGSYHYMSPEQWEGREADARSDIFSFGALLYETLTGRRAFEGKTPASVAGAILHTDPPPVSNVQPMSPPVLDRVVRKCLAKDPEERWQSARDLKDELQWIAEPAAETGVRVPSSAPLYKRHLPWVLLVVTAAALLALSFVRLRETPPEAPVRKFAFTPGSLAGAYGIATLSPNGKRIAYITAGEDQKLWVRDLDKEAPRAIADIDRAAGPSSAPFWSPDSEFVAFAAGGKLKRISVDGGPAVTLCSLVGTIYEGGAWSPDGSSIVFSTGTAYPVLYEVPAQGGTPKLLFEPEKSAKGIGNQAPNFLPPEAGARSILFEVGSYTDREIVVKNLETGERRVLAEGAFPVYSPSGHILYQTAPFSPGLWALPFSIETLEPTGEPFPIAENAGAPSVALDGTLVYVGLGGRRQQQLMWRDREGKKLGAIGRPQQWIARPALSFDDRRVAVRALENDQDDIWVHDVARAVKTRLTFAPVAESDPVWSPSGDEVTYRSIRQGDSDIFHRPADGSGEPVLLVGTEFVEYPRDWSRDGRYLLYEVNDPKNKYDLWYLKRKENGQDFESVPFLQTAFSERGAQFSLDGRFVAYCSDESGRYEVYVRPFPEGEGKWQVSSNGGCGLRWSKDGRELFYVHRNTLTAVSVATAPSFSVGTAKSLFEHRSLSRVWPNYDVSANGQRFVLVEALRTEGDEPPSIQVVQNWFAEFREGQKGNE